jgi:hypothetical protein
MTAGKMIFKLRLGRKNKPKQVALHCLDSSLSLTEAASQTLLDFHDLNSVDGDSQFPSFSVCLMLLYD